MFSATPRTMRAAARRDLALVVVELELALAERRARDATTGRARAEEALALDRHAIREGVCRASSARISTNVFRSPVSARSDAGEQVDLEPGSISDTAACRRQRRR